MALPTGSLTYESSCAGGLCWILGHLRSIQNSPGIPKGRTPTQGIDHSTARARKEKRGIPDLATGASYTQPQTGGPRGQRGAAVAQEPWGTRGAPEPRQPSGSGGGARKRRSCCLAPRRRQTASWEKCMPGSFLDLISRLLPVPLPNRHGGKPAVRQLTQLRGREGSGVRISSPDGARVEQRMDARAKPSFRELSYRTGTGYSHRISC